eukprot:10086390-Heterocapsa_arctica.AAC.1
MSKALLKCIALLLEPVWPKAGHTCGSGARLFEPSQHHAQATLQCEHSPHRGKSDVVRDHLLMQFA